MKIIQSITDCTTGEHEIVEIEIPDVVEPDTTESK